MLSVLGELAMLGAAGAGHTACAASAHALLALRNHCCLLRRKHWFRVPTSYDAATGVLSWTHTPTKGNVYFAYFAPYRRVSHAATWSSCTLNLPLMCCTQRHFQCAQPACRLPLPHARSQCAPLPTAPFALPAATSGTRSLWRRCSAKRASPWRCWRVETCLLPCNLSLLAGVA